MEVVVCKVGVCGTLLRKKSSGGEAALSGGTHSTWPLSEF